MTNAIRRALPLALAIGCLAGVRCPAADAFQSLDLRQVKVAGEIGRRIDVTLSNNLLVLDADRDFLAPFQKKSQKGGYIGLGKLIDAAVRLAAYSGDSKALGLKRHLVDEAIHDQEADGYLGLMRPDARVWELWDIHEISYLIYALAADHRYFHEARSLQAARRLADYLLTRWSADPQRKPGAGGITVHMAVTGSENALLALHAQTGDARYLDFVREFRRLPEWQDRIVVGRWGQIEGHAYAHLCRTVAQLRLYRLSPDPRLLGASQRVVDFLTRRDGLVVTGACGDHECWHQSQQGTMNLGETCATAYLIRLYDELLRMRGESRYGDLMERSIYNALFAAQSPDGRRIRYYSPFDGPRVYWQGDTYCCPCNYRRIVAELPGLIYYQGGDGLTVNLYAASSAQLKLPGGVALTIRQKTDYPRSGQVAMEIEPARPARFALRLRVPRWCTAAKITVGGQPLAGRVEPGTFAVIDRTWQAGDRVSLDLAMPWRLVRGRQAQSGRVVILRGPMVYCLSRSRHPALAKMDLRLLTLDPKSLEGPVPDDALPGGVACRVKAWGPGKWYPHAKPELNLTLTEFPDPAGEAAYFNVPNPNAAEIVDDELGKL
jgi:DUF1680 family protein